MYENGTGVKQSNEKAAELYKLAADQGSSDAQYNLGVMYENGHGIEQSYKMARQWFTKAAEGGDTEVIEDLKRLDAMEEKTKPAPTPPAPLLCSTCGTPETTDRKLNRCSRCRTTRYCSTACQRKHWREGGHKKECKKLRPQQTSKKSTK